MLDIGSTAPDFTANTNTGDQVTLSELCRESRVVLVFYPGDDTAVCTKQLCSFRDSMSELKNADCTVLGVNPAAESKHAAFAGKYHFPFRLVVDAGGAIARQYQCRAVLGIILRTVYVIDRDRSILYVKRGNPPVSEILEALK